MTTPPSASRLGDRWCECGVSFARTPGILVRLPRGDRVRLCGPCWRRTRAVPRWRLAQARRTRALYWRAYRAFVARPGAVASNVLMAADRLWAECEVAARLRRPDVGRRWRRVRDRDWPPYGLPVEVEGVRWSA